MVRCISSSGVSSTARKREGWNFKCALTFRYNQAPPAIAYIHYCKTLFNMKLQATKQIKVFIDKKMYGNTKVEHTDVGKIPEDRRENLSWKGCYYTIKQNEVFYFDRSNNWDVSFFKLENGAEFKIDCGDFMSFVNRHSINIC